MPSIFLPRKEANQPHGWLQLTSTAEIPDEFLKGVAMKFHEHSIDDIHHFQSRIEDIVNDAIHRSIRDDGIVKDFVMNFSLDIHTWWNDIEGKPDFSSLLAGNFATVDHVHSVSFADLQGVPNFLDKDLGNQPGEAVLLDATGKLPSNLIQINWNDIVNTPVSFPSVWDDIANKPATYPPATHTHNYEPAFSKNTAFNKNFGTTAGTVCQGNDTRLSWTPKNYDNNSDPDLASLISGSFFGTIVDGKNNSHYVIGLQNNDASDSFCVVGTDFSTSDNLPYTQLYFRCSDGLFQYKNNDIWHDGNINDKLGVVSFESDGIRITNSFGADAKIKPIFVSEGAYTLLDIEIDNQTKIRASTWSIELYTHLLARDIRGEDISCDGLRITDCPTYSSSLPTGAVYKDANGFLKIK